MCSGFTGLQQYLFWGPAQWMHCRYSNISMHLIFLRHFCFSLPDFPSFFILNSFSFVFVREKKTADSAAPRHQTDCKRYQLTLRIFRNQCWRKITLSGKNYLLTKIWIQPHFGKAGEKADSSLDDCVLNYCSSPKILSKITPRVRKI